MIVGWTRPETYTFQISYVGLTGSVNFAINFSTGLVNTYWPGNGYFITWSNMWRQRCTRVTMKGNLFQHTWKRNAETIINSSMLKFKTRTTKSRGLSFTLYSMSWEFYIIHWAWIIRLFPLHLFEKILLFLFLLLLYNYFFL